MYFLFLVAAIAASIGIGSYAFQDTIQSSHDRAEIVRSSASTKNAAMISRALERYLRDHPELVPAIPQGESSVPVPPALIAAVTGPNRGGVAVPDGIGFQIDHQGGVHITLTTDDTSANARFKGKLQEAFGRPLSFREDGAGSPSKKPNDPNRNVDADAPGGGSGALPPFEPPATPDNPPRDPDEGSTPPPGAGQPEGPGNPVDGGNQGGSESDEGSPETWPEPEDPDNGGDDDNDESNDTPIIDDGGGDPVDNDDPEDQGWGSDGLIGGYDTGDDHVYDEDDLYIRPDDAVFAEHCTGVSTNTDVHDFVLSIGGAEYEAGVVQDLVSLVDSHCKDIFSQRTLFPDNPRPLNTPPPELMDAIIAFEEIEDFLDEIDPRAAQPGSPEYSIYHSFMLSIMAMAPLEEPWTPSPTPDP